MRLICRFILVLLTFILIIVLLKSLNFDQYPFKQSAEVNDSANDEVIEELLGSEPNKEGILANGRAQEVSYGLLAVLFKNGPSGAEMMNDNKISSTEFSLSVAIVVVVLITSLTLLLTAICCVILVITALDRRTNSENSDTEDPNNAMMVHPFLRSLYYDIPVDESTDEEGK